MLMLNDMSIDDVEIVEFPYADDWYSDPKMLEPLDQRDRALHGQDGPQAQPGRSVRWRAALLDGKVDAIYTHSKTWQHLQEDTGKIAAIEHLSRYPDWRLQANNEPAIITCSDVMAEEHPELVVTFLKAMIKVGRWANEHKRAAAVILDRQTGSNATAPEVDNVVGTGSVRRVAKRTLTSENILRTVANCAISFPVIIRSIFRPKTSKAMREKIMLGVTAINDCRYCAWGHSHWAFSQGVSLEEVNQILGNQDHSLKANDPSEAAAILFGQHYAEHLDQIDPDSVLNLRNYFSQAQVREIVAFVYFITFTNLSGNTVDALLERTRGEGRPITVVEGVAGVVLAPLLLVLVALVKLGKIIGTDKRRAKRHRPPQDISRGGGSTHRT